jgi:hypothetical protein
LRLEGIGLVEPIATLDPTSLNFGNQPASTRGAEQTVMLKNDGAANLQIFNISLAGGNANDFIVAGDNCSGNSIPPESGCKVRVQFNPSVTGSHSAVLEFNTNAQGSPHQVTLSGVGTTPPARTLNPTSLAFGNQPVGSRSATKTITLTNNGSAPLTVGEVRVIGPNAGDLGITAETCRGASIAPGATCSVSIAFSPTAVGRRTASLEFNDNAPGSSTVPLKCRPS